MDILEGGKDSQKSSLGMWRRRHLPCISDDSGDEERQLHLWLVWMHILHNFPVVCGIFPHTFLFLV